MRILLHRVLKHEEAGLEFAHLLGGYKFGVRCYLVAYLNRKRMRNCVYIKRRKHRVVFADT